jgi:hypothetical protein
LGVGREILLIYGCNSFAANQYTETAQSFAFSVYEKTYIKKLNCIKSDNFFVEYSIEYDIGNGGLIMRSEY